MDPITIIDLVLRYGPTVTNILATALSNQDIKDKIEQLAAPIADMLEVIGSTWFPKADPALHLVAGALRAFDRDTTKWLQGALNVLVVPVPVPPLEIDGIYGPKTRAAVEALQAQLGLKVDGVAGTLTQAAIMAALAK